MKTKIGILMFLLIYFCGQSQQKLRKPSFMVLPAEDWCVNNNYYIVDEDGKKSCDYASAFSENQDLNDVMSKLSSFFQDRFASKFLLKKYSNAKKTQTSRNVRSGLTNSSGKTGKSNEDTDFVRNYIDADIRLELSYRFTKEGPKNTLKFRLDAVDGYSDESVATISNKAGQSTFDSDYTRLIEEELNNNMDSFFARLESYFNEMYTNGLKVSYEFQMMNDSDKNFESEYNGKELTNIIEDWFVSNTVGGQYSLNSSSDEVLKFSEVRVPVSDENGRSMSADLFAEKIKKYFQAEPYNFKVSIRRSGLGFSIIQFSKK